MFSLENRSMNTNMRARKSAPLPRLSPSNCKCSRSAGACWAFQWFGNMCRVNADIVLVSSEVVLLPPWSPCKRFGKNKNNSLYSGEQSNTGTLLFHSCFQLKRIKVTNVDFVQILLYHCKFTILFNWNFIFYTHISCFTINNINFSRLKLTQVMEVIL